LATVADQMLRPLPMTRVANAGPGLAVGLFAIDAVLDGDLGCVSPFVVAGLAVGGFLAVKGYNVSVECAGQRVTVHGRLWIRTINRVDIIAMTEFLAISWCCDGRRR
jgi:hypothetical protein